MTKPAYSSTEELLLSKEPNRTANEYTIIQRMSQYPHSLPVTVALCIGYRWEYYEAKTSNLQSFISVGLL
jgi:hypothetical protein